MNISQEDDITNIPRHGVKMNTASDPAMQAYPVSTASERHMTRNREFQGIPGIETTKGGRLWAVWYTGGKGEGPDNFVVLVKSDDGGQSWLKEPLYVVDPPGKTRAFDSTLWLDPTGKLWLFWTQNFSPELWKISDGKGGVWAAVCENPDAEKLVWSHPRRIANGIMMNKPIVLSSGEWLLPTAVWADGRGGIPLPEEVKDECSTNVTISRDNGKTFQLHGRMDIPERWFDEHMLVELKDGRIMCLVRTQYGIAQSFSSDKGKTWTKGEDSGIYGPNSRFFISRCKSGRLLLVNHPRPEGKEDKDYRVREKLTAYLSDDDGKSWKGGLLLDERQGVSYPDGTILDDGSIVIIYDWERCKEGDILAARFTEEEVLAGKISNSKSYLKKLISHTGGLKN